MDIKQLVEDLKAKGTSDEEIKKTLEGIKAEIDAILNPQQEADAEIDETATTEDEDAKRHEVFAY